MPVPEEADRLGELRHRLVERGVGTDVREDEERPSPVAKALLCLDRLDELRDPPFRHAVVAPEEVVALHLPVPCGLVRLAPHPLPAGGDVRRENAPRALLRILEHALDLESHVVPVLPAVDLVVARDEQLLDPVAVRRKSLGEHLVPRLRVELQLPDLAAVRRVAAVHDGIDVLAA